MANRSFEFKWKDLTVKWEDIARGDLLDDAFNEFLAVNKGVHAFMESGDIPLNESSYQAQVALLNSSMVHQLEAISHGTTTKRFQDAFFKLDLILSQSETLPKTPTLVEFQRYARSCLYYRLGDYLTAPLKNEVLEKSQYITGLCAYALALDHLCRGLSAHEALGIAEAFHILELYILLTTNLPTMGDTKVLREALQSDKLVHRLTRNFYTNSKDTNDVALMFLPLDVGQRVKGLEIPKLYTNKLLEQIWHARRHESFLKRFLWIRAHCNPEDDDFLDTLVTRFTTYPRSLSSLYSVQDFSRFDLKLIIYRMSMYAEQNELQSNLLNKGQIYPPHFQPPTNKQFQRIWSTVNVLCDMGDYRQGKNCDQIAFVSTLEEIRRGVSYKSEPANLAKTAAYLWNKTRANELNIDVRQMILELFKRYASAVINPRITSTQESPLFPPIKKTIDVQNEIDIRAQMYLLLAQHSTLHADYTAAENYAAQVDESSNYSENAQFLLSKIRQRGSKNGSPSSFGSFQMVDEMTIQGIDKVEDFSFDDTFISCNSNPSNLVDRSQIALEVPSAASADNTLNETLNALTLRQLNIQNDLSETDKKILCKTFDQFNVITRRNIEILRKLISARAVVKTELTG